MDYLAHISWPARQRSWGSTLLWLGLSFLTLFIPLGYGIELIRRTARLGPREVALPPLSSDRLWGYWKEGLVASLLNMALTLPLILAAILSLVLNIFFWGGDNLILRLLFQLCSGLGSVVTFIFLPAILMRMALQPSQVTDLQALWGMVRSDFSSYLPLVIVGMLWQSLTGLGLFFCEVGIFFTNAYYMMAFPFLLGSYLYLQRQRLVEAGLAPEAAFSMDGEESANDLLDRDEDFTFPEVAPKE